MKSRGQKWKKGKEKKKEKSWQVRWSKTMCLTFWSDDADAAHLWAEGEVNTDRCMDGWVEEEILSGRTEQQLWRGWMNPKNRASVEIYREELLEFPTLCCLWPGWCCVPLHEHNEGGQRPLVAGSDNTGFEFLKGNFTIFQSLSHFTKPPKDFKDLKTLNDILPNRLSVFISDKYLC